VNERYKESAAKDSKKVQAAKDSRKSKKASFKRGRLNQRDIHPRGS
jgi:hypothetical protein